MTKVKYIVRVTNKPSNEAIQALNRTFYNIISSNPSITKKAS